jgi:hypothetical protein
LLDREAAPGSLALIDRYVDDVVLVRRTETAGAASPSGRLSSARLGGEGLF